MILERDSEGYRLYSEVTLPRPRDEIFEFFSRAENLEKLTPRELSFQILTPTPIDMQVGALIDYRIRLSGIPMGWRTRISIWEPPARFADEQLRGPYLYWIHEHRFTETAGGTRVEDEVRFLPRVRLLAPLSMKLFVGPQLRRIFAYRTEIMKNLFGEENRALSV